MGDPSGFFSDDFTGIEGTPGMMRSEAPPQYAVARPVTAEVRDASTGSKGIHMQLKLDDSLAMSPKATVFEDVWITEATEPMTVGFTQAFGLGRTTKRFGKQTTENDKREKFTPEEGVQAMQAIAQRIVGRPVIVELFTEVDKRGVRSDQTAVRTWWPADERNITAIQAGGFDPRKIGTKEEKLPDGRKVRFLVVKTAGSAAASKPAAGAPAQID